METVFGCCEDRAKTKRLMFFFSLFLLIRFLSVFPLHLSLCPFLPSCLTLSLSFAANGLGQTILQKLAAGMSQLEQGVVAGAGVELEEAGAGVVSVRRPG